MKSKATPKQIKEQLKNLTATVFAIEKAIDAIMKEPSSYGRGEKVADILNKLTLANQVALRYGLDYSMKKIADLYGYKHEPMGCDKDVIK